MTNNKTLNLADLIKDKMKYKIEDAPVQKTLKIPRLKADIGIEVTKELCRDAIEMAQDESNESNADHYMIYSMVIEPNLKDKELQSAYECEEPTDIVPMIFTEGEISDIVEHGFKSVGYEKGTVSMVEDLKN